MIVLPKKIDNVLSEAYSFLELYSIVNESEQEKLAAQLEIVLDNMEESILLLQKYRTKMPKSKEDRAVQALVEYGFTRSSAIETVSGRPARSDV